MFQGAPLPGQFGNGGSEEWAFPAQASYRCCMSTSDLYLSFNEIMFYFTRAAVGGGVPFGLAEDFGRAAIWIAAASGLDP